MRSSPSVILLLLAAFIPSSGCEARDHVGEGGLVAVAMTEAATPFASSDEAALYIVERRVELPLEPPTQQDLQRLAEDVADVDVPYPRLPWVRRGDYEIEVDWAIKNLGPDPVFVAVTVNGFNEFDEYLPSFVLDNDEIIPEPAMWEWRMELDPDETRSMTTREEEMDEVAVDLATVVNGLENANLAVDDDSHSSLDPRVQEYIPEVIPALTGFRIGMRVLTGGEPAPRLVLEATVRVRDVEDRLAPPGLAWELPEPAPFTPAPVVDL